jgi:hypothetical protein
MDGRRPRLGLPALGITAGGVLAGHWLTYLIVRPDHHDRAALLAATGHGYLGAVVEVAWLVALVAIAGAFLSGLARSDATPSLRSVALRLAAFQLGAFVMLEIGERAVAGSFEGLLAVALMGAAVQLVVAAASAWLLRRLTHAAAAASSILGRGTVAPLRGIVAPLRLPTGPFYRPPSLALASIRGPPSL